MIERGDDLTRPRKLDFVVVIPNQQSAEAFAGEIRRRGFECAIEETNTAAELPWDVVVARDIVPEHGEITRFEELLEEMASDRGGRNDGWGCLTLQ